MKSVTQPTLRERVEAAAGGAARLSFAVALVLIPFRLGLVLLPRPVSLVYPGYTDLLFFAADAAVLSTLAFWSLSLVTSPRRLLFGPRALWVPLGALLAIDAASITVSYDPVLSAYHAVRLLILVWFLVFILNEIRSVGWIVVPVTIQVVVQSVVALAQFTAQRSVDLQRLGEPQLNPSWSGVGIVVANGVRLLRAYGLTDHPNILGGCLAFSLVFLLGAYLHGSYRSLDLAAFTVGIPALLVTFSRAAWLAFLAGSTLIILVEIVQRRWEALRSLLAPFVISGTMVASILLSYATFFGVRLNAGGSFTGPTEEQQSIGERVILIKASLPIIWTHPILGVGLGASPVALQQEDPGLDAPYEPPHMALLEAALETGILGAVAYSAAVLLPFYGYLRLRRQLLADRFATTSLAVLLALAVVGLFDYYTWLLAAGILWQWLAWGIWGLASLQLPYLPLEARRLAAHTAGVSV